MQTDDIAAWLTAIWDEEERMAERTVSGVAGMEIDNYGRLTVPSSWVLARIAADRQILALHHPDRPLEGWYWTERVCAECRHTWHKWLPDKRPTDIGPEQGCPTVRLLALPHADRPGYQEAWRPEPLL